MILLDTNVLSEFMRPLPWAGVVSWLDEQPAGEVYTSAISRAAIENTTDFELIDGLEVVNP